MRWLVEVTSLATTEKESLHVEAETWQKALQFARGQRGDTGPMSGFSIELLDEGCRAVDPTSRMRYEVRRAPEAAPGAEPKVVVAVAPASVPPRPEPQPQAPARKLASASRTMMMGSASPTAAAPAAAPLPIAPVAAVAAAPPAAPAPAAPPAPSTLRADVAANVPSQIVFKREQDATESMPLTYREYIYGVPPGTGEAAAETLLSTQLEFVRASLERASAGKLVNLAVVDAPFEGKPKTPPLATLMWKDWRGAPVVSFPRRPGYAPPAPSPPASGSSLIQAGPFPAMHPPAAVAPAPAPTFTPPIAPVFAPAPAPGPVFAPGPAPVPAPAPASALHGTAPPPPRTGGPTARVRGEDLVADLFEAMHDLHFLRDAIEGGDFCLTLAMEKLPSQAGIVHLYDIDRREFLVTNTRGNAAQKLLLLRHAEDEPMLAAAMRKRRALVIPDAAHSEAASIGRYVTLGGVQSLIIAPVMQAGRFLGAIELFNPVDAQPFTESEGNAVMYIADQLAEFVGARGVVTDADRIAAQKGPGG